MAGKRCFPRAVYGCGGLVAMIYHRPRLLKAPGSDPRKEVISATHEELVGEESLKELLEGCSFWSISSQTREPLCTLHGARREGHQSHLKGYTSGSKELQTGIFELDNEQQQFKKDLESGQVRTKPACVEEQQVLESSFVDGLVCKLVSQLSPTACPHVLEKEFKDLSLQDTKLGASVSCLEGNTVKHVLSPVSLEGLSVYVGESEGPLLPQGSGEVAVASVESNVGSPKLKSVLRGGHEKAGLGPRPKVHVTWAPDVYDPPYTSTSHTSIQNHRRHHHNPKSEHKSRHKGKGSSHLDSHKKSQKKMLRRSKHAGEAFLSGPTVASQRGILNTSMWKEFIVAPPLDDLTLKSAKVNPFILPPKGCFLNPVLSLGERDLVTLEKIQGYCPRHVQTQKLCL